MEKYRILYTDKHHKVVAIKFAHHRRDYVAGDFYVRAIKGTTEIQKHNQKHTSNDYTPPYKINEVMHFIKKIAKFGEVRDCLGLRLEDEQSYLDFNQPIRFRTIPAPNPIQAIDTTAIRYNTWEEDTRHILSVVWGEDIARKKVDEYRLPEYLVELGTLEQKIRK